MIIGAALTDSKIEKIWTLAYHDALACGLDDRKAEQHANDKARAAAECARRRNLTRR
jgi:hypothetical protein